MTYEETVELEKNVKIKDEAEKICRDFKNNVVLRVKDHEGEGRFKIWSDSHNAVYVRVADKGLEFQCRFLHETYNVMVEPASVFSKIKSGSGVIDHLKAKSRPTKEN